MKLPKISRTSKIVLANRLYDGRNLIKLELRNAFFSKSMHMRLYSAAVHTHTHNPIKNRDCEVWLGNYLRSDDRIYDVWIWPMSVSFRRNMSQ